MQTKAVERQWTVRDTPSQGGGVRMEQRQHPTARLTLRHGFSSHVRPPPAGACGLRLRSEQTPERDRRWEADVTTDLYVTSDPCSSTGFLQAPV